MAHKVAVIGSGAVGATVAQRIVESGLADVVLVDILGKVARGKAFDLLDAASVIGHERTVSGLDDYAAIGESDIVVITAGLPRKPGMSRDDLVAKNAAIVADVAANVRAHAPSAIVIVVTNPLDAMTYLAYLTTGFPRQRVLGMAGILDGSRMAHLIAEELKVPRSAVETCVMGSHGDTMVPLLSRTRVFGRELSELMTNEKIKSIVQRTRDRGAEIVSLLGTGSAYYSPSAAVFKMVAAILGDRRETMVVSSVLAGEYGQNGIAIGVPCVVGRAGIIDIVQYGLVPEEQEAFERSAINIRELIRLLPH